MIYNWLTTLGQYLLLMGRTFSRPERMRMFFKQYIKEMAQLGVNSIGIVLLISFFIGAVICIQMKLNIQSPWMPRWVSGYTTREIMLLEFSSSIMCLILAGKVGSNIASEIGTMRVTQQIDALEIMGVNSASYLILHSLHRSYHASRRFDTWSATLVQGMVCVDEYHQKSLLCLYHLQRTGFLRLYGRGRLRKCRQGQHRCRGIVECPHPVQ